MIIAITQFVTQIFHQTCHEKEIRTGHALLADVVFIVRFLRVVFMID